MKLYKYKSPLPGDSGFHQILTLLSLSFSSFDNV